jgi:hypothetical protein
VRTGAIGRAIYPRISAPRGRRTENGQFIGGGGGGGSGFGEGAGPNDGALVAEDEGLLVGFDAGFEDGAAGLGAELP